MSVLTQSHPWHRILPNPIVTVSSSASNLTAPQNAPVSRNIADSPEVRLAPQHDQVSRTSDNSVQVAYQQLSLPSRSVQHLQTRQFSYSHEGPDNLNCYHTKSIMLPSDEQRRSISPSDSSVTDGGGKFCLCQHEPHIPRPRNAFILYRQHQHPAVVAQNPSLPNPDISKIIGEQWRALPESIKEEWKALADEEKARHSQQYPDYRYRPKRAGKSSLPSLIAGPSSNFLPETHAPCQKCGGKPVNTPTPSPFPTSSENLDHLPGTLNTKSRVMATHKTGNSPQQMKPNFSLQHSTFAQQRQQNARPHSQEDYAHPVDEHAEAKRRRLNEMNPRNLYREQFQMAPGPMFARPSASLQTPVTPHYAHAPTSMFKYPQYAPQRRDPNLILPPLQTISGHNREQQQRRSMPNQRQNIEAMIMSIPVLNKIKILSQISPAYSLSEHTQKDFNLKGAVIAVEGMDATTVFDMTNALAEQLEKDAHFSVRIFGGPEPYHLLEPQQSVHNNQESATLNFTTCLEGIARWHTISEEIKDYVNGSSRTTSGILSSNTENNSETPSYHGQTNALHENNPSRIQSIHVPSDLLQNGFKSPISAISPKTVTVMANQSESASISVLDTVGAQTPNKAGNSANTTEVQRPKSRIPAAALARSSETEPTTRAETSAAVEAAARSDQQPAVSQFQQIENWQDRNQIADQSSTANLRDVDSQTALPPVSTNDPNNNQQQIKVRSPTAIPIAIIPHYQLTTVNASAINMPIKDTYSPHSHWQWLATLWRGCVGPDITIVLKSTLDDGDLDSQVTSTTASAYPATPASAHPSVMQSQPRPSQTPASNPLSAKATGVEIRLSDYRTIIVKTGAAGFEAERRLTSATPISAIKNINSEAWEKAKRRVGFEVDEYLRK